MVTYVRVRKKAATDCLKALSSNPHRRTDKYHERKQN
jgi:hypothetical protein